jgi:hypothetical protein
MSKGLLEVSIFEPVIRSAVAPGNWRAVSLGYRPARTVVRLIGVLATAAIHLAFVTSIMCGLSSGKKMPRPPDPNAIPAAGSDSSAMELVAVSEPSSDEADGSEPDAMDPAALQAIAVTSPAMRWDRDLASDESGEGPDKPANASVDQTGDSQMYGRYLGQMDARIERVWTRPRKLNDAQIFTCRTRIEQDTRGVVREITLLHCTGDTRWQLSLVHAIQAASPLPLPPDPKVFTS